LRVKELLLAFSMNVRLQPTIALMTRAVIRRIPAKTTIPINANIGFRSSFYGFEYLLYHPAFSCSAAIQFPKISITPPQIFEIDRMGG